MSKLPELKKIEILTPLSLELNGGIDLDFLLPFSSYRSLDGAIEVQRIHGLYIRKKDELESFLNQVEQFPNLEQLELLEVDLHHFPMELISLRKLRVLNLALNQLRSIPEEINQLGELEELYLDYNKSLKNLPQQIGQLSKLRVLSIVDTNIQSLPETIKNLSFLERLTSTTAIVHLKNRAVRNQQYERAADLRDTENKIQRAQDQGRIHLNNDFIAPPPEIVAEGVAAINNYFRELEQGEDVLYEAKLLILGEGGAGKTTLQRKLMNEHAPLPTEDESTKGIEIHSLEFVTNDNRVFHINLWDFGGQEIYHATHQFFLTKRSLYVLVSDSRKEDTDFNYWLQTVELFGDNSPLLIVQNEKADRYFALNETGIKARFSNAKEILQANLATNRGLAEILMNIKFHSLLLPHVGDRLPKTWVDIRTSLQDLAQSENHISQDQYFELCRKNDVTSTDRALSLSQYLHDIGVFLHFQHDGILKNIVILNNEWATDAVYRVLDNELVKKENKGSFTLQDLKEIWSDPIYKGMEYELLQLMIKFELCYLIEETGAYIAPQLLPSNQPSYDWPEDNNLMLRYNYEFMPKGIITRFIVRMNRYIKRQDLVWKQGIILAWRNAEAEILETYGSREISIRVQGRNKKLLMTLITECIDQINDSFNHLEVRKLIPCHCELAREGSPNFFDYERLEKLKMNQRKTVTCERDGCFKEVQIADILDGIALKPGELPTTEINFIPPKKVFLSYAAKDKEFLNYLLLHLAPIRRANYIDTWSDGEITTGSEWKDEMVEQLHQADIILLVVTANFLASDFHYLQQLETAMKRHEAGEAIVIPIIFEHCVWHYTPFAKLKSLPQNGQPVNAWGNRDEALTHVASAIGKMVEEGKST